MIEWQRIADLRDEIGAEDFDEVVDLFLDEVEGIVEKLRSDPNLTELEEDLHFLKGSALSLGFRHFSGLCQEGEIRSASGAAEEVNLADIVSGFEQSKAAFLSELPQRLSE